MAIEFMPHGRIVLIHFLAWDTFSFIHDITIFMLLAYF